MYSEMIGPYPFQRFTVVENFFPTGYGMPAWTLLGQQVIRLPFIVLSSLGHEVLHNWWGNSIYVDYNNGNWCEGLTVYGADYYYKLQRSPAAARDYRKDILKAYKNYVTPENEFPVREFIARHNAESRTIGYNKAMMIFHMIEDRIGRTNFLQAWRDIYAAHKGEQVTWEQWLAAYEQASGEDLSFIIPQWVDRTGAADIAVELLETASVGDSLQVKIRISQPRQVYNLKIPVHFSGGEGQTEYAFLATAAEKFEFMLPASVTSLELDPDYDLFRQLYPEEIYNLETALSTNNSNHRPDILA
jgi:aminopeptidase N